MGQKYERIDIRLTPEDKLLYKKYALSMNISLSEFIRQACQEKIEKENYKKLWQIIKDNKVPT